MVTKLRDCSDLQNAISGVYPIYVPQDLFPLFSTQQLHEVYCDTETENGGWTVSTCYTFDFKQRIKYLSNGDYFLRHLSEFHFQSVYLDSEYFYRDQPANKYSTRAVTIINSCKPTHPECAIHGSCCRCT